MKTRNSAHRSRAETQMKRNRKNVQLILIDGSETCIASAKKLRHENDAQTLSKHVTILMDIMQCRHSSGRAGTGPHTSAKWSVECPNIPLSIYPASASIIYAYTSGGRIVSCNWHQFDITTHAHTRWPHTSNRFIFVDHLNGENEPNKCIA